MRTVHDNGLPLMQVDRPCRDVAATTRFFTDVLGHTLLFRADTLAFVDIGGVRLYLRPAANEADIVRCSTLYFRTPSIEECTRQLVARGAHLREPPHIVARLPGQDVWLAFVDDPDGRMIGLMEERNQPLPGAMNVKPTGARGTAT